MEPGQFAAIPVTFLEDRDGRALVRLPNGSKTRLPYGAMSELPGRGHVTPGTDDTDMTVWCRDCDWSRTGPGWWSVLNALSEHHAEDHRGTLYGHDSLLSDDEQPRT
jgi:hypothetical protein